MDTGALSFRGHSSPSPLARERGIFKLIWGHPQTPARWNSPLDSPVKSTLDKDLPAVYPHGGSVGPNFHG